MDVLVLYLTITVIGYFIGVFLAGKNIVLKGTGMIQTIAIILLVFVMGSRIGAEESIVKSLGTIGVMAFIITCFILAGSVLAILLTRKLLGFDARGFLTKNTGGKKKKSTGDRTVEDGAEHVAAAEDQEIKKRISPEPQNGEKNDYTMLLCIFVPVTIGILAGFFILPQRFIDVSGTVIVVGLSILLFFVGHDLGVEGTIVENFRRAGWRVILFPFVVIAGTYLGAAAAALILPISIQDALCVGSGFGWYTLAPVMLAEYSIEISAISFMHNVLRELMGLLLLPIVAKKIGYIESTGLVGAGSMDVCLPIIVRATGGHIAVYAFIIGLVLSTSVPILVSFMMSL